MLAEKRVFASCPPPIGRRHFSFCLQGMSPSSRSSAFGTDIVALGFVADAESSNPETLSRIEGRRVTDSFKNRPREHVPTVFLDCVVKSASSGLSVSFAFVFMDTTGDVLGLTHVPFPISQVEYLVNPREFIGG